jgi:hypothetical protein
MRKDWSKEPLVPGVYGWTAENVAKHILVPHLMICKGVDKKIYDEYLEEIKPKPSDLDRSSSDL